MGRILQRLFDLGLEKAALKRAAQYFFAKRDKENNRRQDMAQGRFEVIYTEGADQNYAGTIQILVDRETGVNYLLFNTGNGAGITPLLDQNGKVIIS